MKNFNFFDKLFEQCRTLRRVGMVLVMCLTVCGNVWADQYTITLADITPESNWYEVAGVGRVTNKTGSAFSGPDYASSSNCSKQGYKTGSSNFTIQTYIAVTAIKIWAASTSNRNINYVTVQSTATTASSSNTVDYTAPKNGSYHINQNSCDQEVTITFSSEVAANKYINVLLSGNADIIAVTLVGPCSSNPSAPTGFTVGSITGTGATFSITDAANTNNYEIYYSTSSTAPTSGTAATTTSTSKTKAVTDLTGASTYYAWVRAKCDASHKSDWVALSGSSFTTNYAVTYAANGGSGTMTAGSVASGSNITLTSNAFMKDGYSFAGWVANVDVTINSATVTAGTVIADGATLQSVGSNITLTAQWTQEYAIGTYTFDGALTVGSSPSKTVTGTETDYSAFRIDNIFFSDTRIQFEGEDGTETGSGTNYKGWKLKKVGTIKFFVQNNSSVSVSIGQWGSASGSEPQITYTSSETDGSVTTTFTQGSVNGSYPVKGGTMVTITTRSASTVTLKKIIIESVAPSTKRIYMEAANGWNNSTPYFYAKSWGVTGSTVLMTQVSSCETNTFYADIPAGDNNVLFTRQSTNSGIKYKDETGNYNQSVDINCTSNDKFTFNGTWDKNSTGKSDFNYGTYSAPSYTVTYNKNGDGAGGAGSVTGSVPTDSNSPYSCGDDVTVLGNTGSLALAGYSFNGWNTADDGSGTAKTGGQTYTISANTTFYAQWTREAPTSVSVTGGFAYFPGQTITFTAVPTGGTSDFTYQWQKYTDSEYQDIPGATSATYTKSNCTISDCGSYRCKVSKAGLDVYTDAGGNAHNVRIHTLNGNYTGEEFESHNIAYSSGTSGTVTLSLNANSVYEFKIFDNYTDGRKEYGYATGNYIISPVNYDCGTNNANIRLFTGPAGDYTFTVNLAHVGDNSPYVNVAVGYPSVTHPAAGYAYFEKPNDWTNVYLYWYTSDSYRMTNWEGAPELITTANICGTTYYYAPIGTEFSNVIYKGNGSNVWTTVGTTGCSGKYLDKTTYASPAWAAFPTYTISFEGNSNTGGSMSSISSITANQSQTITSNAFTRNGYTFAGWKADVDVKIGGETVSAGTVISDGATIQNICGNIELTAQWSQIMVSSITLDPTSKTLTIDETQTITPTVLPAGALDRTITWTTSDKDVATVDGGVVTAVGAGTATITATANDGSEVYAECEITVNKKTPTKYDFILDKTVLCGDETATLTLEDSEDGVTYELRSDASTPIADTQVEGDGSEISWSGLGAGTYRPYAVADETYNEKEMGSKKITVSTGTTTSITTGPTSVLDAVVGSATSLSVTAAGTSLTYQWKQCATEDGTYVNVASGGTSATYNVTPSVAGTIYYKVVVTGTCGTVTSSAVSIVATAPVLYTVTFDANGGTIDDEDDAEVTQESVDEEITLLTPDARSGYIFEGWEDEDKTLIGDAGDGYTPTANITLYAKWTEVVEKCETMNSDFEEANPYGYNTINGVEYNIDHKSLSTSDGAYLMTEAQHIEAEDDHEYDNYMYMSIGDRGIIKEIKITVKDIGDANDDAKGIKYTFYEEPVEGDIAPDEMTTSHYSIGSTETFSVRPSSGDNVAFGLRPAGTWIKIESICIYYEPAPSSEKQLLGLKFSNGFDAFIDESKHTVTAYYLYGTDAPTVSSYTVSDEASYSKDGTTITVTAEDGSTQDYTLTLSTVTPYAGTGSEETFTGSEPYIKGGVWEDSEWNIRKNSDADSRQQQGLNRLYFFIDECSTITLTSSCGNARNIYVYRNGTKLDSPTSIGTSGATIEIAGSVSPALYAILPNGTNGDIEMNKITITPNCTDPGLAFASASKSVTLCDDAPTNALTNTHGVTVSYTSSDEDVATVASDGTITLKGAGETTITASSSVETVSAVKYCADEATYTITVASSTAAGLSYSSTSVETDYGASNFTNTLTNSNSLSVTYSSSNEAVATVDENGEVTIKAAGTTIITASSEPQKISSTCYAEGEASYTLTVYPVYTVSYDAMGGTCSPASANTTTVLGKVTLPSATHGTYTSYTWVKSDGTPAGDAGKKYTPSGSMTLYAKWEGSCASGDPVLFSQNINSATAVAFVDKAAITYSTTNTLSGLVGSGDDLFTSISYNGSKTGGMAINSASGANSHSASGVIQAYKKDNGAYWSITRTTDFAGTAPTALKVEMDIWFDNTNSGSNYIGPCFAIGDDFSDGLNSTSAQSTSNVHSGFCITDESTPKIANYSDGSTKLYDTGLTESTWLSIAWIINNTGSDLTYDDPDGDGTTTLANDKFDIWLKTQAGAASTYTKVVSAASAITGTKDLQNIHIGGHGGKQHEFMLDNVKVTDLNATPCYTVTYNGNGATSGYVNDPAQHTSGSNVTVKGNVNPGYTRTNYEFNGWNTKTDGSGTAYASGGTISGIASNTILYAQWKMIISSDNTNFSTYDTPSQYKDVVVTNGATLTITNDAMRVRNITVETGSTLNIAKDGESGVTFTVNSLSLVGGWGSVKGETKYDMPRVYIDSESSLVKDEENPIVNFDIAVTKEYTPIAVPFRVKVSAVDYAKKSLADASTYLTHYAIRTYNGEQRAKRGANAENWAEVPLTVKVEEETVDNYLEPGRGYILAAKRGKGDPYAVIRFPMYVDNAWTAGGEKGTATINKIDSTKNAVSVTAWEKGGGETTPNKDKGWNILGVPYMSCFASSQAGHNQDNPYVMGKLNFTTGEYSETSYAYVNVPTHDFSEYVQEKVSDAVLVPGWCFFVQFAKTGTLTFAATGERDNSTLPIYAPKHEQEMPIVETGIILSSETASDKTTFLISDKYSAAEYEINADLEKMFGENSYTLATYSLSNDTRLAYNAMSRTDATNVIPIGYRAPAEGEYTFAINPRYAENGDFERIDLIDYETGFVTNLLQSSYTFTSDRTQSDSRFALNVVPQKETPTDVEPVTGDGAPATGARKVIIDNKLYIILNGKMYDAKGVMVK